MFVAGFVLCHPSSVSYARIEVIPSLFVMSNAKRLIEHFG